MSRRNTASADRRRRSSSSGARLVMLLILALILGGLWIGILVPVRQTMRQARVSSTRTMMRTVDTAVVAFRKEQGRLPNALDELVGDLGLLDSDEVPTDAWGNVFFYEALGDREFELISFGADGKEGGDGEDGDIDRADLRRRRGD